MSLLISSSSAPQELSPFAKTVYFAHRRGAVIVARMVDGQRLDKSFSWKATRIGFWLNEALPRVGQWLTNTVFHSAMQKAWGVIEPEFRLQAHPRYTDNVSAIIVSDDLIPALRSGRVLSTHGIRKVVGPRTLEMDDGSVLEDVDAVIACTGYNTSFDILGDAVTFTQTSDSPKVPPQPDLYQNVFSLSYPDSLAFLNFIVAPENAAGCRELAAMAIAQVWAGKSSLPPMETMKRDVAAHQIWFEGRCLKEPVPQLPGLIRGSFWLEYMHQMAGTGLYEYLGGGGSWLGSWKGWLFALKNPRVYLTMAYGVNTPHLWRHFETGKRKAWKGAWEAIERVNRMSREDLAKKEDKRK
jgi:dimethylaniline monooxygenase (N-oxide forming)